MAKGDRCAVFGCNNDRRFPEKYVIKEHTGFFREKPYIRFWSCKDPNLKFKDWTRRFHRKNFKVNECIKVCSNHFENPTSEKIILNQHSWIFYHCVSMSVIVVSGKCSVTSCRPVCQILLKKKGDSIV